MNYYMGVDFGKAGGLAVVDQFGTIVYKIAMPTKDNEIDIPVLVKHLELIERDYAPLVAGEKLHAIFGSAAKSTFNFGHDYGVVKTLIGEYIGECELVKAISWQKRMFTLLDIKTVKKKNSTRNDTKAMALHAALSIWVNEVWVESPRYRRIHDGMIDAALIAYDLKERAHEKRRQA